MNFSELNIELRRAASRNREIRSENAYDILRSHVESELKRAVEQMNVGAFQAGFIRIAPPELPVPSSHSKELLERAASELKKAGFVAEVDAEDGVLSNDAALVIEVY
ncbi:hypothetical protein LC612_28320 [Nostoc sp. CHAB 5834]|nr:hypothetical protein [Nostoc sp. CHAB 5834]